MNEEHEEQLHRILDRLPSNIDADGNYTPFVEWIELVFPSIAWVNDNDNIVETEIKY